MHRRDEKFPDNGFEAWGGYMQAKIAKLEEQFSTGISKAGNQLTCIFKGISIYVNGFTIPSAEELKELMAKHGGVYHTYQRNEDFIIASNLPDTKVKNMSLSKVVKAEWITDSIAANRLLDFRNYLLYRNSRTQPRLNFIPKINMDKDLIENKACNSNHIDVSEDQERKQSIMGDEDTKRVSNTNSITIPGQSNIAHSKISEVSTKTAADPNFISEFYNNSRLHHISQLGACFKQHVNDLRDNSDFIFLARDDLKSTILLLKEAISGQNILCDDFQNSKIIMHIDMDCFFVSVGICKRPELKGKPLAVTHSKGGNAQSKRSGVDRAAEFNLYKQKQIKKLYNGKEVDENIEIETRVDNITDEGDKFGSMSEISSCSYEARAKGISNGMFMGAALRLCPELQTIPYDFEGYKEVAYTLYNTIAQYTLDIEAVSCDEMYVDCTELLKYLNVSVHDFATALREEIKSKTGCPCSTGFGGNRLQARLATKQAKPDGQFFLTANLVDEFIFNIKLKDLPGVGRQTAQKLESLGHKTCGSLQSLSLVSLQNSLGNKTGVQLYDQCRGHDPNPLTFHTVRKSVSAEVNYGIRFEDNKQCEDFLKQLSTEVHSRMQQFKVIGKCVTLKLMVRAKDAPVETAKFMGHGFCDVINKSSTLQSATNDVNIITKEVISIFKKQNIDPKEMRGVGIQITKLDTINSKHEKGAINKFFTVKTINKSEQPNNNSASVDICNHHNMFQKVDLVSTFKPSTPKKTNVISLEKKSPVIGSLKSPRRGKGRGRPRKILKPQVSISQNLIGKFLQGPSLSNKININKEVPVTMAVDSVAIDQDKQVEAKQQGLLGLPWEKVRELLRAWFDSGQTPKHCDVDLVTAYLCEMVARKNIDKVYILVNFIKRRIKDLENDTWYYVQDCLITEVQNAMLSVYGKKLLINDY